MKKIFLLIGLFISVTAYSQVGVGVGVGVGKTGAGAVAAEVEGALLTKAGKFLLTSTSAKFVKTKTALIGYVYSPPKDLLAYNLKTDEKVIYNFIEPRKRRSVGTKRKD